MDDDEGNPPSHKFPLEETERRIIQTLKDKLVSTGEREYLRQLLKKRLQEYGWEEEMQDFCQAIINNKALTDFTMEEFVDEIAQESRAAPPDPIRQEIYGHIKKFLDLGGTQKTD